ncbi:MAG: thioredoxin [Erysipelotrichaceae bacterium]|nr:thioredoxin [Erysipelotrichaceae bacterium]
MRMIKDEAEFDALLAETKSVFVDFYADWCGPCKMVSPLVEKLSGTNTDVTFVKVNVDDVPELAQRYGVMSIPTLIAVKNGELAGTVIGYHPEPELQALVDAAR